MSSFTSFAKGKAQKVSAETAKARPSMRHSASRQESQGRSARTAKEPIAKLESKRPMVVAVKPRS